MEITKATLGRSTTTKTERYKWKVRDKPGKYASVPKERLLVDSAYQRELNQYKVKDLRGNWSFIACGALIVVRRDDGSFYVIDGQHRLAAALARAEITHLPCLVFEAETTRDEARSFLAANKNRKPLTSIETFKADIEAGNPLAIEAQRLLTEAGYVASKHEKAKGTRAIGAILACLRTDADAFRRAWPGMVAAAQGQAIKDRVIQGLFWIERHAAGDTLEDKKWTSRLAQLGQDALLAAAAKASVYYASGGAQVWGPGMLLAINKRMRERFQVDKAALR